ncbi:MAG: TatD family hydrolase [bacterium]|nr:TatD family hydrolase [bacterium]
MAKMKFFDAHSHLHGKEYDTDREEVIARMKEVGVITITVGTDLESSKKAVELAERHEGIYATTGVHPTDTKEIFDEKNYEELARSKKMVAVGECGLDYYRLTTDNLQLTMEKERQIENFKKQVEFALKVDKPLMIHCRPSQGTNDAHEDMLSILSSYSSLSTINYKLSTAPRGNIHFFTGTTEVAQKYFDLGFTVSLSGVITFAKELETMVRDLPLDKILSETDCPFASPIPFRGKRNEPSYVVETVKKIAEIKGISSEEVAATIMNNTKKLFRIA